MRRIFLNGYISLLRGINVSGKKRVNMKELEKLYISLGFKNVQTYIQSGNVVFECPDTDVLKLANKIEKRIEQHFGFDVVIFIRTRNEFEKLVEETPFAGKDDSKCHVTFLSEKPASFPNDEMEKAKDKKEEFVCSGKEVYLLCPNGYGRTKLSNNFFERQLKVDATTRNWKTVSVLFSMTEKRFQKV